MQDIEAVKNKVNLLNYILADAPQSKAKRSGTTTQISPCPFCSKGTRTPHFAVYEASNSFNSFGCELNGVKGGTIIDYIMARENLDQKEAVKKLYQITNTPLEEAKPKPNLENLQKQQHQEQSQEDIEKVNKFCLDGFNKMLEKDKLKDYLTSRNLNADAISKYHLFISKDLVKDKEFVIIPILEEGKAKAFIGRNLDKADAFRYRNSKGTTSLFNKHYLKQKADADNNLLFICEGVFDAISIEEQGFKAISLNSTNNVKKLIDAIKENLENAKSYKFILATDTDESGQKAKEELQAELTKLNLSNSFIDIPYKFNLQTQDQEQYKDVNEWLQDTDKETFKNNLENSIYNKFASEPLFFYMDDYFNELANYSKQPTKSTGFKVLDEQLDGGLKSGLYVLGAIPSLRKNNACFTDSGQRSKTRTQNNYI